MRSEFRPHCTPATPANCGFLAARSHTPYPTWAARLPGCMLPEGAAIAEWFGVAK